MVSLIDKCFSGILLLSPRDSMWFRTAWTLQVQVYRGSGGLTLKIPLVSLVMIGCWPMLWPSTCSCTDEIADR